MDYVINAEEVIDMPGGDRTGPAGMGPMTGRAAGYCAGYPVPGYANPIPGRGGFGYGRGWRRGGGRGRGWGRGFGFREAAYPYGNPYYEDPYLAAPYYGPEANPQQEARMLKEQAKAMQEEINAINGRIKELESSAESQDNKK